MFMQFAAAPIPTWEQQETIKIFFKNISSPFFEDTFEVVSKKV